MNELHSRNGGMYRWCITVMAFVWVGSAMADEFLPVLETRTGVYSNVTVTLKTSKDVHIRHDRGILNIDLEDLDDETKAALGYQVESGRKPEGAGAAALTGEWLSALQQRARSAGEADGEVAFPLPTEISHGFLGVVLLVGLLCHLFFSYCSKLICIKSGDEPGFMIWLPILQIVPLFRAAGMSGWWVLGLMVPVLNLVVQIMWCIKIVNARGKHVIWAILMILPLVNLVAFMYLAFSDDGSSRESPGYPAYTPRPV